MTPPASWLGPRRVVRAARRARTSRTVLLFRRPARRRRRPRRARHPSGASAHVPQVAARRSGRATVSARRRTQPDRPQGPARAREPAHRDHRDQTWGFSFASTVRTAARARLSRERTVPMGMSRASAISAYESSPQANRSSTSRSPALSPRSAVASGFAQASASTCSTMRSSGASARTGSTPVRAHAWILPNLVAAMSAQQIGRDAVQPRPRVGARAVVSVAAFERDEKGLGEQVVGNRGADAARQIAVHRSGVPVEQRGEADLDQVRVSAPDLLDAGHTHICYCPQPRIRFPHAESVV